MPGAVNLKKLSELSNIIIPFKGEAIQTEAFINPLPATFLKLSGKTLKIIISSVVTNPISEGKTKILSWLRSSARNALYSHTELLKQKYGFEYQNIRIKDTKSRWGSCSVKGNLNYSWRLIMAPDSVLKYVVVHETAHLEKMNHSDAFWKIVFDRCPDYIKSREWLKTNGSSLMHWSPD